MRPTQQTLAASGFERYRTRTRREQFPADMNRVVPRGPLVDLIAPVYPKGEGAGRPPVASPPANPIRRDRAAERHQRAGHEQQHQPAAEAAS